MKKNKLIHTFDWTRDSGKEKHSHHSSEKALDSWLTIRKEDKVTELGSSNAEVKTAIPNLVISFTQKRPLAFIVCNEQVKKKFTCCQHSRFNMRQLLHTSGFTNVRKRNCAWNIVPFWCRIHFRTILAPPRIIRFSAIPMSVSWTWSINPQPTWLFVRIPVQTNPCSLRYFCGNCLLFSLWIYHDKVGSECFTGEFCCIPV